MDKKNLAAIAYGPEYLLAKFANLPDTPDAVEPASQFYATCGKLYPGLQPSDYWGYVRSFRQAWKAKSRNEFAAVGKHLELIFDREQGLPTSYDPDDPASRPAVVVDYELGSITVKPRTLLDQLAKWILEYRQKLAICERPKCKQPYFVKTHPRQRFCSPDCANPARQESKERWWKENRDRFITKWRKERKGKKQAR